MSQLEDLFTLSGKVAAVTGGGGVLCGAICRVLGEVGVKVAVLDLRLEAAQKVAEDIRAEGGEALAIKADVLSKESLEAACSEVLTRFDKLDILINGAGGNSPRATTSAEQSFFDLPIEAIRFVFDLNFLGTLLASQVFGKLMAQQGEGCILNISSMSAFQPLTNVAAYSAAKAAVNNFTQWLAVHMSQNYSPKIRINAIAPGFFLTEQNRYLLIDEATGKMTPRGQTIIAQTPMGRFGLPEDLLSTVLWLLSPGAAFIHGAIIPVDGGFSAFSGV